MPSTCDLLDERPELGCCLAPLRSFGARREFSGTIATVSCFEDNVVMREVLAEPGDGRVLVVDGGGSIAIALLGDAMAARAAEAGWAGLIVNGAVRDVEALAKIDLGLLALASVPRRSRKDGVGAKGVPVSFGGATFQPGGTVWCDADGVVVAGRQA
ncbi:MAG TPA: ribonuclease E activity regulator RraA [Solirubrobacterales bacterium]|nr:ribonuclease E activity regulator RraA [Solirubrobacterales bacterium]